MIEFGRSKLLQLVAGLFVIPSIHKLWYALTVD